MGKLREQLHEETMKLEMVNWIKERNLKSSALKSEQDRAKDEMNSEVSPL